MAQRWDRLHRAWLHRRVLGAVFVALAVARLAIVTLPFRRIARWLGPVQEESSPCLHPDAQRTALRVRCALRVLSPRTPWVSNCFPQALAAFALLSLRGVPCTLYLGARYAAPTDAVDTPQLGAHAWVRAGGVDVCGGATAHEFAVLARFSRAHHAAASNAFPR